ncbi:MAG: hypothetical protein EXS42_08525 [Lacunisphaera sp.]|nr:hypothetical protein [Lacunisphaera sp.]
MRNSYSQTTGAYPSEEIAAYHSKAGFDETVAPYLKDLQAAGWNKASDSDSGSGLNRPRMIEWHLPAKEADTTALKAAPAVMVDPVKTATFSKSTGAAPLGPPPTNLKVESWNPYSHNLTWAATGWTGFDLFRLDSNGRTPVSVNIKAIGIIDHAFLEPNTVYRLVVHHADGSEGSLDYTYANPPQPGIVTGLKAEQTGPGKVKLTWNRVQPPVGNTVVAETYQVTSPT